MPPRSTIDSLPLGWVITTAIGVSPTSALTGIAASIIPITNISATNAGAFPNFCSLFMLLTESTALTLYTNFEFYGEKRKNFRLHFHFSFTPNSQLECTFFQRRFFSDS